MFISYFCINFIYVFALFPKWNNLSKLKKRQKETTKRFRCLNGVESTSLNKRVVDQILKCWCMIKVQNKIKIETRILSKKYILQDTET